MIPLRDNIRARHPPFVTYTIIAANVIVFVQMTHLPPEALKNLVRGYGVVPDAFTTLIQSGAPLAVLTVLPTLFTSMFIHGSAFHLVSNMWMLFLFGDNVEDKLGHLRYGLFYMACGVLAMLTHVFLNAASIVPTIGASGAIAAVMGAYLLFFPLAQMIVLVPILFYPLFVQVPAVLFFLIWIATQLISGAFSLSTRDPGAGGVAFWAHVGGFFAGLVLALLTHKRGPRSHKKHRWHDDEYFPW